MGSRDVCCISGVKLRSGWKLDARAVDLERWTGGSVSAIQGSFFCERLCRTVGRKPVSVDCTKPTSYDLSLYTENIIIIIDLWLTRPHRLFTPTSRSGTMLTAATLPFGNTSHLWAHYLRSTQAAILSDPTLDHHPFISRKSVLSE